MNEQIKVDDLKEFLESLSNNGYGNMPIFIGSYPLLGDTVNINFMKNEMRINNTYYDEQMVKAMQKLRETITNACTQYINECYKAGKIDDPRGLFDILKNHAETRPTMCDTSDILTWLEEERNYILDSDKKED